MINNCSISGEDVGSLNTANSLQNSECSVKKEEAQSVVDSMVSKYSHLKKSHLHFQAMIHIENFKRVTQKNQFFRGIPMEVVR